MEGMLSQDEINALLSGMTLDDADSGSGTPEVSAAIEVLTPEEKDAIGEIANISMGTSATTLYSLVNKKVSITTPVVMMSDWENLIGGYARPCVFIQIKYTNGLEGANILILKDQDVKIITDLMMGGDGTNIDDELGELHVSAISEAMNQMMGSSATSLSSMLGRIIDISPPEASVINISDFKQAGEIAPFLQGEFVKISFSMKIGDLVDSTILQLYPTDFAKSLYDTFISTQGVKGSDNKEEMPQAAMTDVAGPQLTPFVPPQAEQPQTGVPPMNMEMQPQMGMNQMNMEMQPQMGMNQMNMGMQPQMGMNQMNMGMQPQMGMNQMNMGMQPQMGMSQMNMEMQPQMNIQPAQFQQFSNGANGVLSQENIGLIMDVPLEVTVELGRTRKSISEILDFTPGTIIELDKIAGEPIDVLVNGKFVAKGEVVVIEENFGIRVTEIVK